MNRIIKGHPWKIVGKSLFLPAYWRIWCSVADAFHLVTWIGFLGCSTFSLQPKAGFQGVMMAWCTNLSGVFGLGSLSRVAAFYFARIWVYFTGIATSAMCLQASYQKLSFIRRAFIGCCTTFAMAGDVANVVPSLIIGGLLGFSMERRLLTGQLVALITKVVCRHA